MVEGRLISKSCLLIVLEGMRTVRHGSRLFSYAVTKIFAAFVFEIGQRSRRIKADCAELMGMGPQHVLPGLPSHVNEQAIILAACIHDSLDGGGRIKVKWEHFFFSLHYPHQDRFDI